MVGDVPLFNNKKRYNTFSYITKMPSMSGITINIIVGIVFNFYIIMAG